MRGRSGRFWRDFTHDGSNFMITGPLVAHFPDPHKVMYFESSLHGMVAAVEPLLLYPDGSRDYGRNIVLDCADEFARNDRKIREVVAPLLERFRRAREESFLNSWIYGTPFFRPEHFMPKIHKQPLKSRILAKLAGLEAN